ncbi:MAG: oppC2 [Rhodospirillaceae bacterium]|nr:MAG: oppC2 [Rhodospirillaceae bacterium]
MQDTLLVILRLVMIVALIGWTHGSPSGTGRGFCQSVRHRTFVLAAEALGIPRRRIAMVHVLPNVASPAVVAITLSVGHINPARKRPQFSWSWRTAPFAELGQHADRRNGLHLVGAGLGSMAGCLDSHHRDGLQFRRRWSAGCLRSSYRPMRMTPGGERTGQPVRRPRAQS